MRVVVTGGGGELGWRVTSLLEADRRVEAIAAMDVEPPRRRLRRAAFTTIDPRDRRKLVAVVQRFEPTAIVHLGVYEPGARATPSVAGDRTREGTLAVLGAAADLGGLQRIVVRSGLEVYGRRRGSVTVPDEDVVPVPTTPFGRSVLEVERLAVATGHSAAVPVTCLRFAPLLGPTFPSPLARVLRLRAVPVGMGSDPPFSVLHADDAAHAVVAALVAGHDGPLNVVGAGAVTPNQALRIGRRIPVPVAGPVFAAARRVADAAGAPLPSHHVELLLRGRTADGARAVDVLGMAPQHSTVEVIRALYGWAPITPLHVVREGAA